MAKMYKRQEKALKKFAKEHPDKVWWGMLASELPEDVWWSVFDMHPHENFDSNVERVLNDLLQDTHSWTTW